MLDAKGDEMFINKTDDMKNNLCGSCITDLRKQQRLSQRELADRLQVIGLDLDKNAIQRIEAGKRFVTDIELKKFAEFFEVSTDYLLTARGQQVSEL